MRIVNQLGRMLALVPLMTACVSVAGGDPDDSLPVEPEPEKAQPISEDPESDASQATDEALRSRNTSADQSAQERSRSANSQSAASDGPLEDVPLVIDLSELSDADGLGDISIQWQELDNDRGVWTKIEDASSQGFTPRQRHVGNQLRVRIEYIDGRGNLESFETVPTPPVRNVNNPPRGEVRLIGRQLQYETLKADTSAIRDKDGVGAFSFRWEVSQDRDNWQHHNPTDWTEDTVVLTQEEVGQYIRAVITYTDGYGAEERIESAATDPIINVNDPLRGDLVVDGGNLVGDTLRADTSLLSDRDGIAKITLLWEGSADGTTWNRLTESSIRELTLDNSLIDSQVRARAIVVDRFGNEGVAVSNSVGPIESINSAPEGTVRILSVD